MFMSTRYSDFDHRSVLRIRLNREANLIFERKRIKFLYVLRGAPVLIIKLNKQFIPIDPADPPLPLFLCFTFTTVMEKENLNAF